MVIFSFVRLNQPKILRGVQGLALGYKGFNHVKKMPGRLLNIRDARNR